MRIDNNPFRFLDLNRIDRTPFAAPPPKAAAPAENTGTAAFALTAGAGETRLPHDGDMPFYNQGNTNGCGTTSLAMIMTYLGVHETQGDIDHAIRRMNIFTAPTDLLEFARSKGLSAEGYNHGSWDEMMSYIDRGMPCQALIDVTGDNDPANMHYVAITGHGTNPDGSEYVVYHDPATGTEKQVSREDFEKMWSNTPLGFDHYFNVYAPSGTKLPPSRFDGIEGTVAAAQGLANTVNNFDRIIHPDGVGGFLHGLIGLPGGVVQTVGGGIGMGLSLAGQWLNDKVKDIPVLRQLVSPFAHAIDGVGRAVGDLAGGIGNAFNDVGGAFESLFSGDVGGFFGGVGNAVGDVVGGAVDAVGDVVGSAVDAVGDFFDSIF